VSAPGPNLESGPLAIRVQSILFVCSENAIRSPIAEALTRARLEPSIYLASAGIRPGRQNPFTTAVLAEVGLDASVHRPRTLEDLEDTTFDLIVTLSPEAHHRALEFTRTMAVDVRYWPTFDPTAVEGTRAAVMNAFRMVRDALTTRIEAELGCTRAAKP
jgi:protein-tyrosine-phosphatase